MRDCVLKWTGLFVREKKETSLSLTANDVREKMKRTPFPLTLSHSFLSPFLSDHQPLSLSFPCRSSGSRKMGTDRQAKVITSAHLVSRSDGRVSEEEVLLQRRSCEEMEEQMH